MKPFDLDVLLWPACAIFVLTLFVTFRFTRNPLGSILAALFKAGIFVLYFGILFDGTFNFKDDFAYLKGGHQLLANDVGVTNLADNFELLLIVGHGKHFIYYLYNTYAFRIFGEGYYAPVACNILLTVLIAYFGARLAVREFRFTPRQGKWFYFFLLLHPDIMAWSTVINGKDILVLLLHVFFLQSVALFYRGQLRNCLLLGIPVIFILSFLRFYVPVLFVGALVFSTLSASRISISSRLGYLLLASVMGVGMFVWVGGGTFGYAISLVQESAVNPVYGFFRMLLTPIPFNTASAYSFLDIPAFIHWILLPLIFFGVVSIFRQRTQFSQFFLTYLLVFVSLYASFDLLQGPRHRVQLDYALAILQFSGLLLLVKYLVVPQNNSKVFKKRGVI